MARLHYYEKSEGRLSGCTGDLKEANAWFSEATPDVLEKISGYKLEEYTDNEAMLDIEQFLDAVQEWWDGLDDNTRIKIYHKNGKV